MIPETSRSGAAGRRVRVAVWALALVGVVLAGQGLRSWIELTMANKLIVELTAIGDAEGVTWAIRAGARTDIEATDYLVNGTLLHIAAARGHFRVLRALVHGGADLDAVDGDGYGRTPLHIAALWGSSSCARELVLAGAHLEPRDRVTGATPLHFAVEKSALQTVRLLLENGANVNSQDRHGVTPLMLSPSSDITRLLLSDGADPLARDEYGGTALHGASGEIARILLSAKVPVDIERHDGTTPLHLAAMAGDKNVGLVRLLLKAGASANAKRRDGRTPLHLAASSPNGLVIVKMLVEAGADVTKKDSRGRTPSQLADSPEVKRLLRSEEAIRRGTD